MNYKLKSVNGKVSSLLKAGNDFVKNDVSVASAQHIIDIGTLCESDMDEYPICVDKKWYFSGEKIEIVENSQRKTKKVRRNINES